MDWDIEVVITRLCASVRNGTYRPQGPHILRAAKSSGLTRPLAVLEPEDQLIFKALVSLAETSLMRGMQEWTRFGRADTRHGEQEGYASDSGWFRDWLRRQGHLWTITENHRWIVETDIANFFPSVQLPFLEAHVQANSNLGEPAVRLLVRILEALSTLPEFRRSANIGLPQENFDCSRVLAHTHLRVVDEAFASEGSNNRFSRYMDDIVIGANTQTEALQFVSRIQHALELIGLYPNTAKTRIISAASFRAELMKPVNDELGEIQEAVPADGPSVTARTTKLLRAHLSMTTRPKGWERVLRRFYSACRAQRNPILLAEAIRHLEEFPAAASNILDYLSVFPLDASRVQRLFECLARFAFVYEDVEILAQEFICQAPGSDTPRFRSVVAEAALEKIRSTKSPWIAVAACVTVGKYGQVEHLRALDRLARTGSDQAPWKLQALTILLGSGTVGTDALPLWRKRFPQARELPYLEAVIAGDRRALAMLADFVAPREARKPSRWVVPPRGLFMIPVLASIDPWLWAGKANAWRLKLESNPAELRDRALWRWWETKIGSSA